MATINRDELLDVLRTYCRGRANAKTLEDIYERAPVALWPDGPRLFSASVHRRLKEAVQELRLRGHVIGNAHAAGIYYAAEGEGDDAVRGLRKTGLQHLVTAGEMRRQTPGEPLFTEQGKE